MKIAIINKVVSHSGGGSERFSADLITSIAEHSEHEVHVFATVIEDVPDTVIKHTVTMRQRPKCYKMLSFHKNVQRELVGKQYDVVYALAQTYPADIYFLGGGMCHRLFEVRFPNKWVRWFRYLIRPAHLVDLWLSHKVVQPDSCRKMIANSHFSKNLAVQYGDADPDRIEVVYNGINHSIYNLQARDMHRDNMRKKLNLDDNTIALCFAAYNWKLKGLDTLVKALGSLGESGKAFRILVCGKVQQRKQLEKIAKQCGVQDQMYLLGPLQSIEKYYAASDVFVLPSHYDPCSGAVIEAMACGLPAITTTSNGASELINHGVCGYVLQDSFDWKNLAQYLQQLKSPEKRREMGVCASIKIADRSIERVAAETLEVMKSFAPGSLRGLDKESFGVEEL